jgi:hypothetical protein
MQTPNLPAICAFRPAWNKGRIVGQKRVLKPKHVWAIRLRLELAQNHRDLALFNMAIASKPRGCDLIRMKVVDVMASGQIKERESVLQSKTEKPVRFEISEGTRTSVTKWMTYSLTPGSEYLWPGRFHEWLHTSTRQYARIVRAVQLLLGTQNWTALSDTWMSNLKMHWQYPKLSKSRRLARWAWTA